MDDKQRLAFLESQMLCANIEALGMSAANHAALMRGQGPQFTREDFLELIEKYGIGHNAAVSTLLGN